MRNPLFFPLVTLLPALLMTIPLVFICYRLAKEKGKNVTLWTILGIIPVVNYFVLAYLVGAANRLLAKKVDRLLAILEKRSQ